MRATQVEIENNAIAKEYKELLKISYQTLSSSDKKLIRKAFDLSVEAHNGQRRKSGEAYVFHPIAVAKIVASEIGLDATSIASALIHDVVEDNENYSINDIAYVEKTCNDVMDLMKNKQKKMDYILRGHHWAKHLDIKYITLEKIIKLLIKLQSKSN